MRRPFAFLAVAAAVAVASPVAAQNRFYDEVKVGLLAHDVRFLGGKESGADINAEVLFVSPDVFRWILRPRPHVGFLLNSAGDTNQVYLGLTWTWKLATDLLRPEDNLFFGFSFGASVNDGEKSTRRTDKKALGSALLFREGFEVGYQFSPIHSLSVYFDHISNGGLAKENQSINNLGGRVGFKF